MDGGAPKKIYFSIGEVSTMLGVPQHVLRYWEDMFPTLRPPKRRTGNRAYRQRDIEKLEQIKQLLYDEGYTIKGARKRLREGLLESGSIQGRQSVRQTLSDVEAGLQKILDMLDADE
jgi:DNA-binding transcriptional MerR regulator